MENNQQTQSPAPPQPVAKPTQMEVMPAPSEGYVLEAEKRSLEFMNPKRWQAMSVMAQTFIQSNALPETIKNAPQLIMVFQAGYEAGLQPVEALNSFYIVNGKLTMYGDTVISQVQKAGHVIEWGECDDKSATIKITRGDNGKSLSQTVTMDMAVKRGWNASKYGVKDVWTKYPESMLKYRAFGMCARFIVPDALRGIAIKEEIEGEIDPEVSKEPKKVTEVVTPKTSAHKPLDEALKEKEEADKKAIEENNQPAETTGTLPLNGLEPKTEGMKKAKAAMDKTKEKLSEEK